MQVSAEIRWFWPNKEPTDLARWFKDQTVHNLPAGGGESRTDLYLVDPNQIELGIKSRGGKSGIEVKGLVSTLEPGLINPPFSGPIELWTKWSSSSLHLESDETVRIEKTRWLRKFDTSTECPREIELDSAERPRSGEPFPKSGCNVEFTALTIAGHHPWWTLGFEAFGSLGEVAQSLQAVALLLVGRNPPTLEDGLRSSYPEWLTEHSQAKSSR